ncbi:gamma-glutamyltransferase [Aliikangiella coralliicola]|uniref:Glutathione hydrolase proenzyme n=1 Tax=Aliikangiella coralliicola TaxID=2592383 RepID=A0A545UFI7_9GAMM|nr:gamma-glutamyltransferase [Aliikangiella coralliicola]TQV88153.1 gamma-glutamyltransferase [Aliikangiella coralliicola]
MKLFISSIIFFILASPINAKQQAAVAMPDRFSAEIAEQVLKEGGNAVDAAIATAFSLAVTLPEAGNIGGGGFMLIYKDKKAQFLDYREVAPLTAHRDMYLDKNGEVIENLSLIGVKSSGVPGTVAGMWQAHKKYANLSWKKLLAPAIELASQGFIVPKHLADEKERVSKIFAGKKGINFEKYFSQLKTGALFKQPELAETLRRIAEHGPDGFYRGKTAQLIVEQMKKSGGLISKQDLDEYRAVWREPVSSDWKHYQIISSPPPSSGGTAVVQLLKMKQLLEKQFSGVPHNSPQYIHLLAEIEKRVYADRAKYMGDPGFLEVPVSKMVDSDYLKRRADEVNPDRISISEKVKPGLKESTQTTHYSIIDQWGNAVSNTYTINLSFGSGLVVEGAGFLLNNEMDDFSAKPGVPNAFGVVGGKANEIAPRKRMLSSMSPTILLEGERVKVVVGSPGGSTIITSVFQTLVNLIDFKMSPQNSVDVSRVHHQLLPENVIYFNPELPTKTTQKLQDMGYQLEENYLGDVQLVVRQKNGLSAAADARGRGESRVINWD